MPQRKSKPDAGGVFDRTAILEWIAAGVGLTLTLTAIGFMAREGLRRGDGPPVLTVRATEITPTAAGYVVDVRVTNRSRAAAAAVEVAGVLRSGGREVETGAITFDYVPGHGRQEGGIVFRNDPRAHALTLAATGYVKP